MDVQIEIIEITSTAEIQETAIVCEVKFTNLLFDGVETVTSTDNHIVVDNTDPKNPSLSFQLVDNENLLTDDELANLNNQSGVNTGDQDLSPYQTITDALLETDNDTIVGAINEVNSIAKGANQALSFDDYQAVIAAMLVSGLNAGQNLYVDTLDVHDLWVKVVEVTSVPYTYVSDEQFITDILAGTQIGYYRLALLETQKVDLTNYYTKDETDQVIEDYAEPLRTTDQNYVSDAELEVLQDTSGVNTGDETQDSLGEKIELTELETVTDTTKIAASDSAFLKWFSGATLKTFLSLTYAKIVDYFSKTESDRRFVTQNGGTIYHITRWFTPTSALTIAANGLSATITSGQFTSAMTGSKLRLTGGVNEPIITYVSSNSITLSFAVDSAFFGQSVAIAVWGVYEFTTIQQATSTTFRRNEGGLATLIASSLVTTGDQSQYVGGGIDAKNTWFIRWFSGGQYYGTADLGIRRISDGLMEIYNGVTNGVLRDLKLRSLFADKIMLNALNTAPSSATDTGTTGEVRITADYIYVCTATNTWKRTPLTTW